MKVIIKNTVVITLITLISGCLLGLVYEITKQPIEEQNVLAKQQAYQSVYSEAVSFEKIDRLSEIQQDIYEMGHTAETVDDLVEAKDEDGNLLGYVVTVTSSEGYGGDIQLTMGIQSDGTVNGISILSISETPGLGMNVDTDGFKNQYKGKKVERFEITKKGAAGKNEIDAVSGATFSSKAVNNSVNTGLDAVRTLESKSAGELPKGKGGSQK